MRLETGTFDSPIGTIRHATRDDHLVVLCFCESWDKTVVDIERHAGPVQWIEGTGGPVDHLLSRYFEGDIAALDDIAVDLHGTEFQRRVWSALRDIAAGTTISYGELARRIGRPRAVRAVGAANGANPVSLVLPCHRVVGTSGTLTGYGGGLHRKQWLLVHEGAALL